MTVYCDSSSLMKLYLEEPGTETMKRVMQTSAAVVTSTIAFVELRSALARCVREHRLTRPAFEDACRKLSEDWVGVITISPDPELLHRAASLSERHALRALDSIHLASFQQVLERTDDDVEFSTFDERLAKAAKKLR